MSSSTRPAVQGDATTLKILLEHVPSLLRGFAAFDNAALPAAIDAVLARLGVLADVDRTYLFRLWRSPDGRMLMDNDHEWCAAGVESQISELQSVPLEIIASWLPLLEAGETVHIPRVGDLPVGRADRATLAAQGIRSVLVTPLLAAGELIGFIGYDAVRNDRWWSASERLLLGVVADAICSALLRQRALRALSDRERRFQLLAEHSADLDLLVGDAGQLLEVSSSAAALMGWDPAYLTGRALLELLHPDDSAHIEEALDHAALSPGTPAEVADHRLRHSDGTWRWFAATAIDLRSEPTLGGTLLVAHAIDGRKRAEAALAHQALHDPLTGLPNRALLIDRLQQALERARRHDNTVAVVFLDLDRFKLFNDCLGHARGDELLRTCAERLQQVVRDADTVARFGGDEFVVILDGVGRLEDAWRAAQRLTAALRDPIVVAGGERHVTASAGFVVATEGADAQELLRDADAAMYQAKSHGRDQLRSLDEGLRRRLLDQAELARELRGAVERGELTVDYQPILSLPDEVCTGYEALARWDHPTRGRIGPDRFIPLAEEHGLIDEIGAAVLERALAQLVGWDERYPGHERRSMSINLSAHQLQDAGLVDGVRTLLQTHRVAADRLIFELTESALMAEPDASHHVLAELRAMGAGIAIDDFGTGYSSLAYLGELPVSMLKIDRSFVARLGETDRDSRVVAVVLNLAREFGLCTVAEGIETERQRQIVEQLGCVRGQGYLLAAPASPAALEAQTFMPMARSSSRT